MSEEDEIFLERSFQRTLIVSYLHLTAPRISNDTFSFYPLITILC